MELTVARHAVPSDPDSGLSPLQNALLTDPRPIRIASAPTGAGKSYAFLQAVAARGERVLFIVPTRRLAQNLAASFIHDLVNVCGWPLAQAEKKVAVWSADQSALLRDQQPTLSISGYRLRQMQALDDTREGGEIVFAVPEVVSHLLLQRHQAAGQAGLGIVDFLTQFDHVVFDEFHTIEARGFGLAALCARLVSQATPEMVRIGRAKVSFLSATPLAIQPVLAKLEIAETEVAELEEAVVEDALPNQGRCLHGDVILRFSETASLAGLVAAQQATAAAEVAAGRQVVIIYNALADLRRELLELGAVCDAAGITRQRVLVINSIDDSRRQEGVAAAGFYAGRRQNPDRFSVLVATASVEMGVTFRAANLMFMEPGFYPMNFLQRYGRAARRGMDGQVWVRTDETLRRRNPWLRTLLDWANVHQGQRVGIAELTAILSHEAQAHFQPVDESKPRYFGQLPNRTVYNAGLYWNALLRHKSNEGPRRNLLLQHQPASARVIYGLLQTVRRMETSRIYGQSAKTWCDRFEKQAYTLRDIGLRVRVAQGDGNTLDAEQVWLARETTVLERGIQRTGADGKEEILLLGGGDIDDYLLDPQERKRVQRTATIYFPHTPNPVRSPVNAELVEAWCRKLREKRGIEGLAWDSDSEAMNAAETLVKLTGLVPSDEDDLSMAASSGVC